MIFSKDPLEILVDYSSFSFTDSYKSWIEGVGNGNQQFCEKVKSKYINILAVRIISMLYCINDHHLISTGLLSHFINENPKARKLTLLGLLNRVLNKQVYSDNHSQSEPI